MKEVKLIRSLRDLAALKAHDLCVEDKPYYGQFLDVLEKKLVDDLIMNAIDHENYSRVHPVIMDFARCNTEIPIPFYENGKPVNQIRIAPDYPACCEVSCNGEFWYYLDEKDQLRMYEAFLQAGLVSSED